MSRFEEEVQAELARQLAEYDAAIAAGLPATPPDEAVIRAMLAHLREEPAPQLPAPSVAPKDAFYRIAEGCYSVALGAFVPADEAPAEKIIDLNPPTSANLRETLEFYHLPLGDCLLTPAEALSRGRAAIDAETSSAILAGFDYEIGGELLHFSYDAFDQQNFADTANACLMAKSGAQGLPETVTWNAYKADGALVRLTLTADEFLALYAAGALAHKAACMEKGGTKKAALAEA